MFPKSCRRVTHRRPRHSQDCGSSWPGCQGEGKALQCQPDQYCRCSTTIQISKGGTGYVDQTYLGLEGFVLKHDGAIAKLLNEAVATLNGSVGNLSNLVRAIVVPLLTSTMLDKTDDVCGVLEVDESVADVAVVGEVDAKIHEIEFAKGALVEVGLQLCLINTVGDVAKHDSSANIKAIVNVLHANNIGRAAQLGGTDTERALGELITTHRNFSKEGTTSRAQLREAGTTKDGKAAVRRRHEFRIEAITAERSTGEMNASVIFVVEQEDGIVSVSGVVEFNVESSSDSRSLVGAESSNITHDAKDGDDFLTSVLETIALIAESRVDLDLTLPVGGYDAGSGTIGFHRKDLGGHGQNVPLGESVADLVLDFLGIATVSVLGIDLAIDVVRDRSTNGRSLLCVRRILVPWEI